MTRGYQAQIKEIISKLKEKQLRGCSIFRVQAGMITVSVIYRDESGEDIEEAHDFGELNSQAAFLDLTEAIHYLNRQQ